MSVDDFSCLITWIGIIASISVGLFATFNIFQAIDYNKRIEKIENLQKELRNKQLESDQYQLRLTGWIQISMAWHFEQKLDYPAAIEALEIASESFIILKMPDQVKYCREQIVNYEKLKGAK